MRYQKILMIDDDHDDYFIFSTTVKSLSASFTIFHEWNGKEALKKLEDSTLQPDIIFLDLNMPLMSGQEFMMKYSKHKNPGKAPVVIYSTSISPNTITLMKQLGATEFINKPARLETILSELRRVLTIDANQ